MKKIWIIGVSLLVIGIGGVFMALHPPAPFRIKEFVVMNPLERIREADLVRETGISKGDNLLTLSLKKVHARLMSFPWVESVAVARAYPSRLVISALEQVPVALVKADQLYLANRKGVLFKILEAGDPKDLPVISGVRAGKDPELPPLFTLLKSFQAEEGLNAVGLSEIHWDPKAGVSLYTLSPVIGVKIGKEKWEERLHKFAKLLPELEIKGGRPLVVDLTYEKRVFVKRR